MQEGARLSTIPFAFQENKKGGDVVRCFKARHKRLAWKEQVPLQITY
jgi:hypothetical protein